MNTMTIENTDERNAMRYLEDQAYIALIDYKEPVRSSEIIGAIGRDQYSAKLIRHVLAASPRFAQIDRRWDLEVRYEDKQRPTERIILEIMSGYGFPMSIQRIANELAGIYDRPADYYEMMLKRILADGSKFFSTYDESFGLRAWLLDVSSDEVDDVVFDNNLDENLINSLEKQSAKVNWAEDDISTTVNKFLNAVNAPVDNKTLAFFIWRAIGSQFDPVAVFDTFFKSSKLIWLSDQRWITKKIAEGYDAILIGMADRLAEETLEDASPIVTEKAEAAEDVAPTLSLNISERDLDEVAQIVSSKGEAKMPSILESIFEISPRDPIYPVAAEGLSDAMRLDSRFKWVGTERWRMADTVPGSVTKIPTELAILKLAFETPEGEPIDIELEDEGLEGQLATEIHNVLVQDVYDEDLITEQDKLPVTDNARCVLTRHHKKLGTFPLCQIHKTFFPYSPNLIEVTLVGEDKRGDVWINRDFGLIYGMGDWYNDETPESGAVFELLKTDKPDEFQFVYKQDTDPLVFVSSSRIEELDGLKAETKKRDLSTFDLMSEIMEHHRKGVSFVTLFTEVNLVRRTTRRMVASILSSYYAFYQRPKSALWQFDEKKADQGFKKAKRKYIRRA